MLSTKFEFRGHDQARLETRTQDGGNSCVETSRHKCPLVVILNQSETTNYTHEVRRVSLKRTLQKSFYHKTHGVGLNIDKYETELDYDFTGYGNSSTVEERHSQVEVKLAKDVLLRYRGSAACTQTNSGPHLRVQKVLPHSVECLLEY